MEEISQKKECINSSQIEMLKFLLEIFEKSNVNTKNKAYDKIKAIFGVFVLEVISIDKLSQDLQQANLAENDIDQITKLYEKYLKSQSMLVSISLRESENTIEKNKTSSLTNTIILLLAILVFKESNLSDEFFDNFTKISLFLLMYITTVFASFSIENEMLDIYKRSQARLEKVLPQVQSSNQST
jgi:hypothetical protein